MAVRTFIFVILSVPAYYFTMRYNMHMFQLNGYKNQEHINWLKKNIKKQWLLIFGIFMGGVRLVQSYFLVDVVCYFTLFLILVVYRAMKRINVKKKLVYTPRVKRMLAVNLTITIIVFVMVRFCLGGRYLSGAMLILVSVQFLMNVVVNIVNYPIEMSINKYYINDAKRKLKEVSEIKIIGITGSYGKTSIKFYLQTLLQEKFNVLVTPESFNTPMGVVKTIRGLLKSTHEIFVCEMGARHVGDIKELCDIVHPNYGVITSIGPQHLDTFINMENIKETKFELADAIPKDGMLFLNGDNEYIQDKAMQYVNKTFYYCKKEGEGYCVKDILVSQFGTEFTVVAPNGETERFQMKLIGFHNVINVVGAIAVANSLGIELRDLKVPVRRIQPVEHRMQMRKHGNVTIIDDAYNSNPVGSKAAVETLSMFDGIKILITPGMVELGNKENEFNYKFGMYVADCCDYVLLVGKKHTEPIKEGVLSKGFPKERCLVYDKLEDALSYAYGIKGHDHKYILLENDLPDNY